MKGNLLTIDLESPDGEEAILVSTMLELCELGIIELNPKTLQVQLSNCTSYEEILSICDPYMCFINDPRCDQSEQGVSAVTQPG